jgi:hypothetical protein
VHAWIRVLNEKKKKQAHTTKESWRREPLWKENKGGGGAVWTNQKQEDWRSPYIYIGGGEHLN